MLVTTVSEMYDSASQIFAKCASQAQLCAAVIRTYNNRAEPPDPVNMLSLTAVIGLFEKSTTLKTFKAEQQK